MADQGKIKGATVTLVITLDELHEAIAESIRVALVATGHKIVDRDGNVDETKVAEMARNAAGGLAFYAVEE